MADVVLSGTLQVFSLVWDWAAKRVNYIRKLKQDHVAFRNKFQALRQKSSAMRTRVENEEANGRTQLTVVGDWRDEVGEVLSEAEMLSATVSGHFEVQSCLRSPIEAYKCGKALSKLADQVDRLTNQDFDSVATQLIPSTIDRCSRPTFGVSKVACQVLEHLQNDKVGTLGLYGLGGIGKTAVLTEVNNKLYRIDHNYDLVIFVTVSTTINASDIILNCIAERIGLDDGGWRRRTQDKKTSDIYRVLSRRRFLLLLDGMLQNFELHAIGIPVPNPRNKSKIVVTSRSKDICVSMGAQETVRVNCLSSKDAWNLFEREVGQSDPGDITKLEIACEICAGLPLALITIGRVMSSNQPDILRRLSENMAEIRQVESIFESTLKPCFDNLESETIKSCFLYLCFLSRCGRQGVVRKKTVIQHWLASGMLKEAENYSNSLDSGYAIFSALQNGGFLEEPLSLRDEYLMGDVVAALGIWISQGWHFFQRYPLNIPSYRADIEEGEGADNYQVEGDRMFLCGSDVTELTKPLNCPNITTLIMLNNLHLKKVADNLFNFMPRLRVLDLSECQELENLPNDIWKLNTLKCLNLNGTGIKSLPVRLNELTEMQYLHLGSKIKEIPKGLISKLEELCCLELKRVPPPWLLEEVKTLEKLKDLRIFFTNSSESFKFFTASPKLLKCTTSLRLSGKDDMTEYLDISFISCMENLERLNLEEYGHMKKFTMAGEATNNEISEMPTSWSGCVKFRHISIDSCSVLRDLSNLLHHAPNLLVLVVLNCEKMKALLRRDGTSDSISEGYELLKRLQTLILGNMPSMEYILPTHHQLPSSCNVQTKECPKLKNRVTSI